MLPSSNLLFLTFYLIWLSLICLSNGAPVNQAQLIYFNFERLSDNKVIDHSGNENDGELINSSGITSLVGVCGFGIRLEGGNILLEGDEIKNKQKRSITIAVWINVDSVDGQQEIFQTINPKPNTNKHGQYYLGLSEGQVKWFHRDDHGETIFSVETPESVVKAGVWIHIGATYQEDPGKATVYINGEVAKEETDSKQLSQDWQGRISIGKFYDTSDTGDWLEGRPFRGIIDEFYLYNRALSKTEVSFLSQICDMRRTVLFYGFENIEGTSVYDQSGIGNNGTLMNGASITTGKCGQGIELTDNGYISLDGDGFHQKPITAISIAAWIRLNTNRGNHEIFNTIDSKSMHKHDQYHYAIEDGRIVWHHKNHYGKEIFTMSTLAVVRPRQWINLIVTYDSQEKKAKVFLNGQLVKEVEGNGYLSWDWGHFAGIGKHYHQNTYFDGAIDELAMFNYALPDDEIQFIANGDCDETLI